MKKTMALILSLLLVLSSLYLPGVAFAEETQEDVRDTVYYQEALSLFLDGVKDRKEHIEYEYTITDLDVAVEATDLVDDIIEALRYDIFTQRTEQPVYGDYLYHSIIKKAFSVKIVEAAPGTYVIKITGDFSYFTTKEQEDLIAAFAEAFQQNYITESMTEYQITKTIYDFLTRYIDYDNDLFEDSKTGNQLYPKDSQRYINSHSAYGAIFSVLNNYAHNCDLTYEEAATGEKVLVTPNQGMSVCEGYAKLFYYLCTLNGIECHIVDGDYVEGDIKDSHEWNYVRFKNDANPNNNNKWFMVDATFASQKSYKDLKWVDYDLFLRGTESDAFSKKNHQQPYTNYGRNELSEQELEEKEQLFDWADDAFAVSYKDYEFAPEKLTVSGDLDDVIVRKLTDYGEGIKAWEIYFHDGKMYDIEYIKNDDGTVNTKLTECDGFPYNGQNSTYELVVPYLIDGCYQVTTDAKADEGIYSVTIRGAEGSTAVRHFIINRLDMSKNYDEENSFIQNIATYSGSVIQPEREIYDSYGNKLTEGRDYTVTYYSAKSPNTPTVLQNADDYKVVIQFKGNYKGTIEFPFVVEKIRLSDDIDNNVYHLQYFPKAIRDQNKLTGAEQYLKDYVQNNVKLQLGKDYTATSKGSLNYGSQGTVTLTGIDSNQSHTIGGNSKTLNYKITEKFDISELNKLIKTDYADSNSVNQYIYNGTAFKPTKFDILDEILVQGTDYKIKSYSNNVNAGTATVTVEGINGCSGTLTMKFIINPASLTNATVTPIVNGSNITCTVKIGSKTLTKGTDYTEALTSTSKGYKLTITGKGNYAGVYEANIVMSQTTQKLNGWVKENGKWCYYKNNAKLKGWQKIGNKWYLFAYADGTMCTGWVKSGGKWYFFNGSGAMLTGWQKLSGKWYFFNGSGAMLTGWQKLSGKWYYFNSSGAMATGWQKLSGKWYYFNSDGSMVTGNKKIGSKTYKFNSSGVCLNP